MDIMLRFADEATAKAKLSAYQGEDGWLTASHAHALDPIGPIVTAPAEVDDEGEIITPAVVDEGFHVNLRVLSGDAPDGLEPYTVHPTEPKRVWA